MVTIDQLLYEDNEYFNGAAADNSVNVKQFPDRNESINAMSTTHRAQYRKCNRDVILQKARQRNTSYRKRRKNELTALREQEAKLRQLLAKLSQHMNQEKTPDGPKDVVAVAAWKAVALRQHERRLESFTLQNLLQAAVNSQAVIIQDLQNAMKKRLQEESRPTTVQNVWLSKSALDMKDAMFYKAYFDSLSVLYGKVDGILDEVGLNATQGKVFAGEPTRKLDGETEYFQKSWVGTVPFTYERTCNAVWALAAVPHRQEQRSEYEQLRGSDDSIGVKYCVSTIHNNTTINMRTYQVARRYAEELRTVVVWRALSDAREAFPGITHDETGWCIVHPPSDNAVEPTKTFVQACIRLTPMHFRGNEDYTKRMVSEFMEVSMDIAVDDCLEIQHMIESLLLDEMLHSDILELDDIDFVRIGDGDEAPKQLISLEV